uniref:Uncharacterized protein n=1 Tax=Tetraselmis sp. GSL018 TaxID=582737 RepID=A0A061SPK1_9CHLO
MNDQAAVQPDFCQIRLNGPQQTSPGRPHGIPFQLSLGGALDGGALRLPCVCQLGADANAEQGEADRWVLVGVS